MTSRVHKPLPTTLTYQPELDSTLLPSRGIFHWWNSILLPVAINVFKNSTRLFQILSLKRGAVIAGRKRHTNANFTCLKHTENDCWKCANCCYVETNQLLERGQFVSAYKIRYRVFSVFQSKAFMLPQVKNNFCAVKAMILPLSHL